MCATGQVMQDGAFGVLIAVTGLGQFGKLITYGSHRRYFSLQLDHVLERDPLCFPARARIILPQPDQSPDAGPGCRVRMQGTDRPRFRARRMKRSVATSLMPYWR